MDTVYFILLLAGAICFIAAAFGRSGVGTNGNANGAARNTLALVPLGLFFWISVALIQAGRVVFD